MVHARRKVRFVTAAALFDGHDAAINIIRRLLVAHGAKVIHLGHNRSVAEIVDAAIQEDAQGIAVSSYQGGHMEFFRYVIDLLRERGGGGVIVPEEAAQLHEHGVARIFTPEDGRKLGLDGMIRDMISAVEGPVEREQGTGSAAGARPRPDFVAVARKLSEAESGAVPEPHTPRDGDSLSHDWSLPLLGTGAVSSGRPGDGPGAPRSVTTGGLGG